MAASVQTEQIITEDEWQKRATASAIASAREVVSKDGINSRASIGSLGEIEWGWIVAAAIFGWIKVRAEQAVHEGSCYEIPIRTMTGREPAPWEAGAIATILPQLGNLDAVPWGKPIGDWSKDEITSFAWQIYKLTDSALARRDEGAKPVDFSKDKAERINSAANGGGFLSHKELNDEIGF